METRIKKGNYSVGHTYIDHLAPSGSANSVCGPGAELRSDVEKQRPQSARSPSRERFLPLANSLGYGNRHKNYYVYTGQQWERPQDPTAPVPYNALPRPDAYRLARESFSRYENMGWEKPAKGASSHVHNRPQPPPLPDGWFQAQAATAHAEPAFTQPAPAAQAPLAPPAAPAASLYSSSYGTGVVTTKAAHQTTAYAQARARQEARPPRAQQPPTHARRPQSSQSARRESRVGFTPWLGRARQQDSINYAAPNLYNTHMPRKPRPQSAFVRNNLEGHNAIFY